MNMLRIFRRSDSMRYRKGAAPGGPCSGMLIGYAVFAHFAEKRDPGDAERVRRPLPVPAVFLQGLRDGVFFGSGKLFFQWGVFPFLRHTRSPRLLSPLHRHGMKKFKAAFGGIAHDDIFQFSDIARPAMGVQFFQDC